MFQKKKELKLLSPNTLKRCTFMNVVGGFCGQKAQNVYEDENVMVHLCGNHSVGTCSQCMGKAISECMGGSGVSFCGAPLCSKCRCERCHGTNV